MRRVIVICEGQTEREFCEQVLASHLAKKDIFIQAPLIKKTKGGIVKWEILKKEITNHLKDKNAIVTTLIDYYGLTEKLNFPKWDDAQKIVDKNTRINFLEEAMKSDLDKAISYRFLPYIQLHEFEGLLFNDIQIFYDQIPHEDLVGEEELIQTFNTFENPEMINENKDTSPSRRLQRIIKGYNKTLFGHYLAEAIGIEKLRQKSPRFNEWINKILSSIV